MPAPRSWSASGRSIIHLELGEPDFHPAKPVNDALKRAIDEGKDRYCPVIGLPALREALSVYLRDTRHLNISPQNIVIAPGCKLALFMAMMALIDPGDEVLVSRSRISRLCLDHAGAGRRAGSICTLRPENHLQPDPDEIAASITSRTKILITNSPGNPTGTVYTDEVQRRLAELAVKHDLLVLSDEIYARIIYGGTYKSMMSYPGMEERTLIIDGFSKSFRHDRLAAGIRHGPGTHRARARHAGGQLPTRVLPNSASTALLKHCAIAKARRRAWWASLPNAANSLSAT